jgi:transcription initiation factor TFIIIB Brf1 subunit/transcription initiation factor TFIIB
MKNADLLTPAIASLSQRVCSSCGCICEETSVDVEDRGSWRGVGLEAEKREKEKERGRRRR